MQPRVLTIGTVLGALACPAIRAQVRTLQTVPAAFAAKEANGAVLWAASPFAARRQLLIDRRHLAARTGEQLTSIAIRRNTGLDLGLEAGRLWVEIYVSNSAASTLRPAPAFAANRGPDHTQVFGRYVNFPATPPAGTSPAPWRPPYMVKFNFSKSFKYLGRSLVLETVTRLTGNDKQAVAPPWWVADAQVEDAVGSVTPYGSSCIKNMPGQPAGASARSLAVGATALFHLHGGNRSGLAILTLGARQMALDLGAAGATGCHLYTDWLLLLPSLVQSFPGNLAQTRIGVSLPADGGLVGANLFAQWIAVDPGVNRVGLTLSNGVKTTLGRPADAGIAWIESTDPGATSGRILFGRFPILQLVFRKP